MSTFSKISRGSSVQQSGFPSVCLSSVESDTYKWAISLEVVFKSVLLFTLTMTQSAFLSIILLVREGREAGFARQNQQKFSQTTLFNSKCHLVGHDQVLQEGP